MPTNSQADFYIDERKLISQSLERPGVVDTNIDTAISDASRHELRHKTPVIYGSQVAQFGDEYTDYKLPKYVPDTVAAVTAVARLDLNRPANMNFLNINGLTDPTDAYAVPMELPSYEQSAQRMYGVCPWLSLWAPAASVVTSYQQMYQPSVKPPMKLQESLDSRFGKIRKPSKFFTVGRVFITLWTEPTKSKHANNDQFSKAWLGASVYSEIRRFVVIREGKGYSLCSPVHTYGGQGTLKARLDASEHAAIFAKGTEPNVLEEEEMVIKPFPVIVEADDNDDYNLLHPMSRINLGKIYTIEHYNRVLKIGRIDEEHLARLQQCAGLNSVPKLRGPAIDDKAISQIHMQTNLLSSGSTTETELGENGYTTKRYSVQLDWTNLLDESKYNLQRAKTESNSQRPLMAKPQLQGDAKPFFPPSTRAN